jgi:hypothetical protein
MAGLVEKRLGTHDCDIIDVKVIQPVWPQHEQGMQEQGGVFRFELV